MEQKFKKGDRVRIIEVINGAWKVGDTGVVDGGCGVRMDDDDDSAMLSRYRWEQVSVVSTLELNADELEILNVALLGEVEISAEQLRDCLGHQDNDEEAALRYRGILLEVQRKVRAATPRSSVTKEDGHEVW